MYYLLKRYKIEDITDDHCQQICRHWLSFLGVKEGNTWNIQSILTFFVLAHSLGIWGYVYIQSNDSTHALHHISLGLLGSGLFLLQALNHEQIMDVAKMADNCFKFGNTELKMTFKEIQRRLFTSWMKKYTDSFIIMVFLTWTNILREVYSNFLFVHDVQPPPGMIVPFHSHLLYIYFHITETLFIIVACLGDVMVAHIFMMISLQITANYEILCQSLDSVPKISPNLTDTQILEIRQKINVCIKHHQEIFRTFFNLKKLFDKIFYLLYFSMMSAIAMCRTLLTGHIDVSQLLPLFYLETGYIHTFCAFADQVATASENVRFAAYSTDWVNFTKSLCYNIRIMVIRASKNPTIRFYVGGSEISCATFTMIINASITYFIVSIIFERQETNQLL